MIIHSVFSASTLSNIYMISNDKRELVIIDPAEIREELVKHIEENRLNLKGILLTQINKPCIEGLLTLGKIYSEPFYSMPEMRDGLLCMKDPGRAISIGDFRIEAIPMRSHAEESCIFRIENALFTGNVLYAGRIAATESFMRREALIKEINAKIMSLDENMLIFPGQGPTSKIRIEKMFNIDLIASHASYL